MKTFSRLGLLICTMSLACGGIVLNVTAPKQLEPDTNIYDVDEEADLDHPHYVHMDDDGEEDQIKEVKKVILHYHNDDGKCGKDTTTPGTAGGRAFYLWVTGVEGQEYMPDYVSSDGCDMYIEIDFSTEKYAHLGVSKKALMFIIKYRRVSDMEPNWGGQSEDIELSYKTYPADDDGLLEVWTMPADGGGIAIFTSEAETKVEGIKYAEFTDFKTIACTNSAESVSWSLYAFDETYYKLDAKSRNTYDKWYLIKTGESNEANFNITFDHSIHTNIVYTLVSLDKNSATGLKKTITVKFDKLYETERFETYYTYTGDDLGVTYSSSQTTFKLWAPTAANVTLRLYNSPTPSEYGGSDKYKAYHMNYLTGGIWSLTVKGELRSSSYNYVLDNTSGNLEVVDPYARATGVNGARGFVFNPNDTNPTGWDDLPLKWDGVEGYDISTPQDLSIYEVHVQDFTGDESWNGTNERGTYNAFVESGTTYTDGERTVTTGYDHLNELGVNAVQLMPVFDHDNDETRDSETGERNGSYNWGYNPLNYNCVEGAYSSNPYSPNTVIKEYKNLILQLSKTDAHTRVIMDVVYNHVSSASSSNFTKIMPRYFFRYDENGEYYDGSGCSNEVKTDAPMMRKFIVDSCKMWATEYKVKGFRFDLMGLIDTTTMRQVKDELYKIDPDIYIYGEGWTAGGYHGEYKETTDKISGIYGTETARVYDVLYPSSTSPGLIGAFNDAGRNNIRGGNDGGWGSDVKTPGWGYISQGSGDVGSGAYNVAHMLAGVRDEGWNPLQTVNYASCHDNYTLYDQLYWTLSPNGGRTKPNIADVVTASASVHAAIMSSNGVAFMLGGEELFRQKEVTAEEVDKDTVAMYGKYITHNSYKSSLATNGFKWDRKLAVVEDGVTYDVAEASSLFAKAIKNRVNLPRYSYDDLKDGKLYSSGTSINFWNCEEGSSLIAFQLGQYFFFFAGRSGGSAPFDDITKSSLLFGNGTFAQSTYHGDGWSCQGIDVNPYGFAMYKR